MKRLIVLAFACLFLFYVAWPAYSGYQIHQALEAQDEATLARKIDFPSVRASMRDPVMTHVETRMSSIMKSFGPATGMVGDVIPKERIASLIDASLLDVVNPQRLGAIYASGGDIGAEIQRSVLKQIDKMGGLGALMNIGKKASSAGGGEAAPSDDSSGGGGSFGGLKLPGGLGEVLGAGGAAAVGDLVGEVAGKIGLDPAKLAGKLFPKLGGGGASSSSGGGSGSSSFGLANIKSFGFAGPLGLQMGLAKSGEATEPDVTAQINFSDFDWKVTKLTPNL